MSQSAPRENNQTIALAGVYLALEQIQTLAWHGEINHAHLKTSINSLFCDNPTTYIEVYGSTAALATGFIALKDSLSSTNNSLSMERNKYLKNLISLSKKFNNNSLLQEQIGTTLSLISNQLTSGQLTDADPNTAYPSQSVIDRIAELYRNTLSTITPKIIIYGQSSILATNDHAATIRALLLCAVRGTRLWVQAGGSGINLVFNRSKYIRSADYLLSNLGTKDTN